MRRGGVQVVRAARLLAVAQTIVDLLRDGFYADLLELFRREARLRLGTRRPPAKLLLQPRQRLLLLCQRVRGAGLKGLCAFWVG